MGKRLLGGGIFGGEEDAFGVVVDADGVVAEEVHSQNSLKAVVVEHGKVYHRNRKTRSGEIPKGNGIQGCRLGFDL